MSRLPPALARRVDRLARRAHAFHRWAHHPLCSAYAPEVIRVGRRARVCLGCALTAAGAVLGLAAGGVSPAVPGLALLALATALVAATPRVVRPGGGARRRPRARKLLTRLLPSGAAAFAVAQAAHAPSPARLAAAALAAAAMGWVTSSYRRRGPDRAACADCAAGPPGARCPGLAPIARRERALSRLAGRWIAAALPPAPLVAAPAPATAPPPRPPAAPPPSSTRTAPRP